MIRIACAVIAMLTAPMLTVLGASAALAQQDQAAAANGLRIFTTMCQACHMQGGAGAGPYPALRGNATVQAAGPAYVAFRVLRGYGAMMPFCAILTVDEVVDIANWVPTHLDNRSNAPPIDAATVRAQWPAARECPK